MSFTEILKILGSVVILALAFVAMKLLSDFEYEIRKDRVVYETLWTQDFEESSLDSLWSSNDGDLGIVLADGTLNLTPGQDNDILEFKPDFPSDSIYFTIRLKWPNRDIVNAKINLVQTGSKSIPLFSNASGDDDFVTLTSKKIACENCHHLNFNMSRAKTSVLNTDHTQWQIDHISLSALVVQKKLF